MFACLGDSVVFHFDFCLASFIRLSNVCCRILLSLFDTQKKIMICLPRTHKSVFLYTEESFIFANISVSVI